MFMPSCGYYHIVVSGRIADAVSVSMHRNWHSHKVSQRQSPDTLMAADGISRRPMLVDGGVRSVVLGLVMFRDTN